MKRTAMMMAIEMLVSAGITRAAKELVGVGPASPVKGGTVIKEKTMTAVGDVKTVTADSLVINDGPGKDWTFVIDSKTKVLAREETIDVPATSKESGKVIPRRTIKITDIKEGQRVEVTYRTVNGKNLATKVRMM